MLRWISQSSKISQIFTNQIMTSQNYNTVVVGSGLAGLTAALRLSQQGISVALVEKTASLGGNSIKASSGINGVPTKYQDQNDGDFVASFVSDTNLSGKGLCDAKLVDILAAESASAIGWLTEEMSVDLSAVSRLGGHSHARTHRGSGKLPPGFAIVSALTKKIKESPNVEVLTRAKLEGFLTKNGEIQGVIVEKQDEDGGHSQLKIGADHVVLATGGFSADIASQDSLIKKYRPDLAGLPSTNGQQTTGDGHRLALENLDAKLVQMDQIQVHPTGFIQLKDKPSIASKWKFLCGELIRGIGGILISSSTGHRFINELATRDTVATAIMEHCGNANVAIIAVSAEDYKKASSHIDFYISQSLMFKGGIDDILEKLSEIEPSAAIATKQALEATFKEYNSNCESKTDPLGRPLFGNSFEHTFYFGFVTPVLHFTMGGVQTNEDRQIVQQNGNILTNVYAIGELSAGVHGANRLAGSSLLECVVFGTRVASHIAEKSDISRVE